MKNNPWQFLLVGNESPVLDSSHSFYWSRPEEEEFGFAIRHKNPFLIESSFKNTKTLRVKHERLAEDDYRYSIILCDKRYLSFFYNLVLDLIDFSHEITDEFLVLSQVDQRLKNWKSLFAQKRDKLLSLEEQRGLIGELLFLKNYLLKTFDTQLAVSAWQGGEKGKQDFSINDYSVEVKTKRSTVAKTVKISSIDQLYSEVSHPFLWVNTLTQASQEHDSSLSLDSLIEDICTLLSTDALNLFEQKILSEYDYLRNEQKYSDDFYILNNEECFEIRGDFPRIPQDLPEGIREVQYELELIKCSRFSYNIEEFKKELKYGIVQTANISE